MEDLLACCSGCGLPPWAKVAIVALLDGEQCIIYRVI